MIIAATRMHRTLVDYAFGTRSTSGGYDTFKLLFLSILLSAGDVIIVARLLKWVVSHTRGLARGPSRSGLHRFRRVGSR